MDEPRSEDLVVEFLRTHNAKCPRCDYSVKGLEEGKCPECGEALVLGLRAVGGIDKLWVSGLIAWAGMVGLFAFMLVFIGYAAIDMPPLIDFWEEFAQTGGFFAGSFAGLFVWMKVRRKLAAMECRSRWILSAGSWLACLSGMVFFGWLVSNW